MLLHLIDIAPFDESVDPAKEGEAIINELKKYSIDLFNKPRWLILNKIDLITNLDQIQDEIKSKMKWKGKVFCISAINGKGCRELTFEIMKHVEGLKKDE